MIAACRQSSTTVVAFSATAQRPGSILRYAHAVVLLSGPPSVWRRLHVGSASHATADFVFRLQVSLRCPCN